MFPNNVINTRKKENSPNVDIKQLTLTPQMSLRKNYMEIFKYMDENERQYYKFYNTQRTL